MVCWFLVASNEPEKLKAKFASYFSYNDFPQGIALWKWKNTCWICSPARYKEDILATFNSYGITEFSSSPFPSELEFLNGDINSINAFQVLKFA
jgi:hypothetical protein